MTPQEYVEEVLALVERIPPGKVMSYGAIADALAEVSGRNSARQVGNIMARHGGAVPWHRVVNSAGRMPPGHEQEARQRLLADGVPVKSDRVDMARANWVPDREVPDGEGPDGEGPDGEGPDGEGPDGEGAA